MYRRNALFAVLAACVMLVLPQFARGNLLSDPGFETGAPWNLYDGVNIESWAAHSGGYGLAFYGWANGGGAYQDVAAGGISNYTLTVNGWRDVNFDFYNNYVQVRLEFLDANFNVIDFLQRVVRGTNQWDPCVLSAPNPPNTAKVRCTFSFSGNGGSAGAFKWDDADLTSSPYNPGADTHYCSPTGTMVYPYTNLPTASRSIAAAVKAANAGDTILIDDGNFNSTSQIDVDRAVTIRSVNGRTSSSVNGSGQFRGFYVTDPNAVIQGLTITNCRSVMINSNNYGSGVYFVNGGVLRDCAVVGNIATGSTPFGDTGYARGGGVYCAVTGRIENCIVAGNSAIGGESSGGGLYCIGNVVVTNCDIFRNSSVGGVNFFYYGQGGLGGGVMALNGARIESCRISNNLAQGQSSMYSGASIGAGIYCASATVSRCVISSNMAVSGNYPSRGDSRASAGGVYVGPGSLLENCLVMNNVATGVYVYAHAFAGGVQAYGNAEIRSCTIVGNRTHPGNVQDIYGGAGIYATFGPVIRNTIIHGNICGYRADQSRANWSAYSNVTMSHCCTTQGTNGSGNVTADPRLADIDAGGAHLLADSPCIDRADNATSPALDLYGNARPVDGNSDTFARADIGACEAPADTTTPNLLLNGTFENPSVWVFLDDARREGWAARNGTNGLAMYGWTDGGLVWQDVTAAGISNYTFTAWGLCDADFSSGLPVEMKIEFLGANWTPLSVVQKFVTGTTAWTSFSISAISPPDTEVVRVVLAFSGTAGSGGAFKWDDAVLQSIGGDFNAHYVAAAGGNIYPFTNWAGASTNLQAAINAADAADTILVSNGTYVGETVVNKSLYIRGMGGVRLTGKAAYPFDNQLRALTVNTGCVLDLRNVTIASGYNNRGGGIYNQGTLVLKDSSVVSNEANLLYGNGGGIYNVGTATLERCTISDNEAHGEGTPGAGTGYGAGIYCANGSVLTIKDSALVRNRAYGTGNYNGRDSGSGYGGAIFNDGGTVTLVSCTVASNYAAGGSAGYNGGHGYGGGIYTRGLVTLRSCTIACNKALQGGATMGGPYLGEGGGIYLENGAPVVIVNNTILAANSASTAGPDVRGTLDASGRNLLGSIADCAIIGTPSGVIIGVSPGLSGLAMNGGPTLTMALLYLSAAIDQGSTDGLPSTDQRGMPRLVDGNFNGLPVSDIGAFEYDPQTADEDGDTVSDYTEVVTYHSSPHMDDSDEDGMNDGNEIVAGTSLTNSASLLAMETEGAAAWSGEGIVIRWQSADNRYYQLMRSTNLASGFTTSWTNIQATAPVNTFTDTTASATSPYYYKVRVE